MYSKYDNIHKNGMFNAKICITNHIITSINCMLLSTSRALNLDHSISLDGRQGFTPSNNMNHHPIGARRIPLRVSENQQSQLNLGINCLTFCHVICKEVKTQLVPHIRNKNTNRKIKVKYQIYKGDANMWLAHTPNRVLSH